MTRPSVRATIDQEWWHDVGRKDSSYRGSRQPKIAMISERPQQMICQAFVAASIGNAGKFIIGVSEKRWVVTKTGRTRSAGLLSGSVESLN